MKKDTRSNVNHSLIDDLLIKAKTKESFKQALNAGAVKSTSIALIEDTDELWTHGKYHRFANNSEVVDYSKRYLRTTALDSGTISFNINEDIGTDMITSISYSKDNGETWFTLPNEDDKEGNLVLTVNVSEGDEVLWKGIAESVSIYDNHSSAYSFFSSTARFNADGNIMSLLYGDNFIGQTTLKYTYQFACLFSDGDSEFSTLLVSAENLSLPATTLTESCYMDMFDSCTSLVTAPKILPATTLAEDCYDCMFYGCTSLVTPPILPATTLADWCYSCMFEDCTSLSVSPKLPATILADGCYDCMFDNTNALPDCTNIDFTSEKIVASGGLKSLFYGTKVTDEDLMNILPINPDTGNYWLPVTTLTPNCYEYMFCDCTLLITAPELPATKLAQYCYYYMFSGCTSLTAAPTLPATTLANYCYYEMFRGCTSLTTAPELSTTILVNSCYESMFKGCTSLNYIKCLGINGLSGHTNDWVSNVAETGTFVKSRDAVFSIGENGIPVGWNIVEEGEESSYTPSGYALRYLKTTALENGKIDFYIPSSIGTDKVTSISYSTDNGTTWIDTNNTSSSVTITVNVTTNQEVLWKGIAERLSSGYSDYSNYASKFTGTARFNVEGNIMSLCYGDNFINEHKINYSDQFSGLFAGSKVVNASNLSLPADKLHQHCYTYMFYKCTSLVNAPSILPATILAKSCYSYMFVNCTSLTTVPELPATILAHNCYYEMFRGCTSLTTAPELPATTLTNYCYNSMFNGCTSLTTPPELPATTLAISCYSYMFVNCTSLTTVPELPALQLANSCYQYMFQNCTALTAAPELLATIYTLAYNCYDGMFKGCTSLNYIKCLLTFDNDYNNNTNYWVANVAPTGIFVKADDMNNWTIGDSGIPTGWVVYTETEWRQYQLIQKLNQSEFTIAAALNELDRKIDNFEQQTVTSVNGMTGAVSLTAEDVKAIPDYSKQYLTFEALENTTFTFSKNDLQYSIDNGVTWATLVKGTASPTINAGSKIMWKQTGLTPTSDGIGTFSSTGNFIAQGNVMSLYYGDDFIGQTDLTGKNYAFNNLFNGCSKLVGTKDLSLPATVLATYCYSNMFRDCSSLTSAPQLPATTLADGCYRYMFNGCTALISAPELPAITLADYCYYYMFQDCTSLTSVPELPATTLALACYFGIFRNCTALTSAPKLPATTLAQNCYAQMFQDCTSLASAPELPAITLVNQCYDSMFKGCSNLNYIKALFTTKPSNIYTQFWVSSVAASGTFVKNNAAQWNVIGNNGIPTGWNAYTESKYEVVRQYQLGQLSSQNELTIAAALNDLNTRIINLSKELAITNTYLAVNNYYSTQYLRTTALESGTIGFDIPANSLIVNINSISYSTDKGSTWTTTNYNSTAVQISINVNAGDEILWKGDASDFGGDPVGAHFTSTAKFNVDGNIMSLLYGDDFYNKYVLYQNNVFSALFYQSKVVNAKNLSLPAVQLSNNCYEYMFGFCSDLLTPPKLSAIKLSEGCYQSMFLNCSSLTTIPELPATELAPHCYESMFSGCTTLNDVYNLQSYKLPATELRSCCYKEMFKDCTHLTRINAFLLPATTLAKECYSDMFNGCSYLNAVPNLPATTLAVSCYARMFKHTETHSMELPAVQLVPGCYSGMFEDCGSISNIKAMFITTPSDTYTKDWLKNVPNYGTFTKNENATWDVAGDNGIPTTWNVYTE